MEGVKSEYASLQSSTVILPSSTSTPSESLHLPTPPRGEFPVLEPAYAHRSPSVEPPASARSEAGEAEADEHRSMSNEDDDKDSVISISESDASSFFDVDAVTTTTESVARERDGDEFDFVDDE